TEGCADGKRGRPTKTLSIQPAHGCVIAVTLDTRGTEAVLFDLAESECARVRLSHDSDAEEHRLMISSLDIIGRLIESAPSQVLCIGISVPGSVDTQTGVARGSCRIRGWKNIDIGGHLREKFGI